MVKRASILGGGSWGMAVARLLDRNDFEVTVCEFLPDEFKKLVEYRTNPDKLPDLKLAPSIKLTNQLNTEIISDTLLILAIPTQYLRNVLKSVKPQIEQAEMVVNLAKGIEKNTLKRMSEVISEEAGIVPDKIVTLSGPSHAEGVIIDLPTTVVAAGTKAENVIRILISQSFWRDRMATHFYRHWGSRPIGSYIDIGRLVSYAAQGAELLS